MMSQMIEKVVAAAQRVHFRLGPNRELAEYHQDLCAELSRRRLNYECEVSLAHGEKGSAFDRGNHLDLVVENKLVIELKTLDRLEHIHDMQVFTFLQLSGLTSGLLFNFHERFLRKGIRRLENLGGRPRSYRFHATLNGALSSKTGPRKMVARGSETRAATPKGSASRYKARRKLSVKPSLCRV